MTDELQDAKQVVDISVIPSRIIKSMWSMFWAVSFEAFLILNEAKIIWRCLEALDMREQKSRRGMGAGSSWKPFGGSEVIGSYEPCGCSETFGDIKPFSGSVWGIS